jgi:hypothetical protein
MHIILTKQPDQIIANDALGNEQCPDKARDGGDHPE